MPGPAGPELDLRQTYAWMRIDWAGAGASPPLCLGVGIDLYQIPELGKAHGPRLITNGSLDGFPREGFPNESICVAPRLENS